MAEGKLERGDFEVELKVNGESIPLNPYVNSVFASVIAGLVSTLKNTPEPEKIELALFKG